jgi:hypothetical protein
MHSETTLSVLDETFKMLSRQLRKFRDFTCSAFTAVELPKEKAARERKAVREGSGLNSGDAGTGSRKAKKFNLYTYKFHAMGDYVRSIRLFGTTDSFTTQIVRESEFLLFLLIIFMISDQGELAHRALKAFYPLTSKLDTPAQLAKHERRRRILRRVAETGQSSTSEKAPLDSPTAGFKDHHYIPKCSHNNPVDIFRFLQEHDNDPAVAIRSAPFIFHLFHDL